MKKTKKREIDKFIIVLSLLVVFFSSILFLSIPVLFDYKSKENQIEKNFYSEFKINLKILDDISYKLLPAPHLLIERANLNLNNGKEKSSTVETKNLKIFVSLKDLIINSDIKIRKLEIQNTNFYYKINDIINFRNHIYYKINKPIVIKKSKFFYLEKDENAIIISPINKLYYSINLKGNYKELKIKGNIFDINYNSLWRRYYDNPKNSQTVIKLKKPNLTMKNIFKFENKSKFSGNSEINFLDETININYFVNEDIININSPNNNQKINISSSIELNPFYFNTEIKLIEKNLNFIIDEFLQLIINFKPEFLGNINGILTIVLENLDNKIFSNGKVKFYINENNIELSECSIEIQNIGIIKSQPKYRENKGDIILSTNNILEIQDKNEFSKKFNIKYKKIKNINKIFFDLEKNIDTGVVSISNIQINEANNKKNSDEIYIINNFIELKSLLKKVIL